MEDTSSTSKHKGIEMEKLLISIAVCATLIILAFTGGATYYNVNDRNLMSTNIESAINRGIDPISVRCSYASSTDTICVAMAASQQPNRVVSAPAAIAVNTTKK